MEFEKLNLKRAKEVLDNSFKDRLDISFKTKGDIIECVTTIIKEAYGDNIYMAMRISDSGHCYIWFLFDYLDKNEDTLDLVNNFNDNVVCLKASISDRGSLCVSYYEYETENTIAQTVQKVLDNLVSEDTVKYLKPLTELTHPKDED